MSNKLLWFLIYIREALLSLTTKAACNFITIWLRRILRDAVRQIRNVELLNLPHFFRAWIYITKCFDKMTFAYLHASNSLRRECASWEVLIRAGNVLSKTMWNSHFTKHATKFSSSSDSNARGKMSDAQKPSLPLTQSEKIWKQKKKNFYDPRLITKLPFRKLKSNVNFASWGKQQVADCVPIVRFKSRRSNSERAPLA